MIVMNSTYMNCSDIIENCNECSNGGLCYKCKNGFYLNIFENSCIDCLYYSTPNMFISDNLCLSCSVTLDHCINCYGNEKECSSCENGFYLSEDKTCENCVESGEMFLDGSKHCRLCYEIVENCKICDFKTNNCTKCQENYYLNNDKKCVPCNVFDYFIKGNNDGSGECLQCSSVLKHCDYCGNMEVCNKCKSNYYRDEKGNCVKCDNNKNFIKGTNDGYGFCLPCSSKLENCLKCNSTSCILCENNFVFNHDNSTCSSLNNNSDNNSVIFNKCSETLQNCLICENNPDECNKCEENFYLNSQKKCVNCNNDAEGKFGNNDGSGLCKLCDTCENCLLGYYLNSDYVCEKCSEECFTCIDEANQCLECHVNYFHESFNDKHCMRCLNENEILENGVCYIFSTPSSFLNNTIINQQSSRFFEKNNNLYFSIKELCRKEESIENVMSVNIYYMLTSNLIDFNNFDLKSIKNKLYERNENIYDENMINFGYSHKNNLMLMIKYSFNYILKYYCVENRKNAINFSHNHGLIHIFSKNHEVKNGKIFMNFDGFTKELMNENSLTLIICILDEMAHLVGKQLIKITYNENIIKCKQNFLNQNISESEDKLKVFNQSEVNSDINPHTLIIEIESDPFLFIDNNTTLLIKNTLIQKDFREKFNKKLQTYMNFQAFPLLNFFEFVSNSQNHMDILPIISIFIEEQSNTTIIFRIQNNIISGLCFVGLVNASKLKNIPSFKNLINKNYIYETHNFHFKSTFFIQKNSSLIFKISNLTQNQDYTLLYATQNLFSNNHSKISLMKFTLK